MRHLTLPTAAILASCTATVPALAQMTYPTRAPNTRVPGTVFMKCDTGGPEGITNCRPVTASDPLPTTNNATGQQASANSQSVTPASDSSAFPQNLLQIKGVFAASGAGATDAGTLRVTLPTDSGLATSSQFPATLGQKAKAGSLAVTLASDSGLLGSVQGTNARNAASTDNPVLGGCTYRGTTVGIPDASRGELRCDVFSNLRQTVFFGDNQAQVGANSDGQGSAFGLYTWGFNQVYDPVAGNWQLARGSTAGAYVVSKGSATLATGQVSVGTTATLIRAADTGRTSITVIVGAANACAFGNSGVTLTTGYLLPATAGVTDTTAFSGALYAVCNTANTPVSYKAILP